MQAERLRLTLFLARTELFRRYAGTIGGVAWTVIGPLTVIAVIWFGSLGLGLVIAAAMVINLVAAALAGILIPLALDRKGYDPAVSSSVFVTTVTDVVGFFSFLGLAAAFLG